MGLQFQVSQLSLFPQANCHIRFIRLKKTKEDRILDLNIFTMILEDFPQWWRLEGGGDDLRNPLSTVCLAAPPFKPIMRRIIQRFAITVSL